MTDQPINPPPSKLSISTEDLAAPEVSARVAQIQATSGLQMQRTIGTADSSPSSSARFGRNTLYVTLLGIAGGIAGALFSELVTGGDESRWTNPTLVTVVFTSCYALCLGFALLLWRGINSGSADQARRDVLMGLPIVVLGGAIGGFAAQQIYYPLSEQATKKALSADTYEEFVKIMSNSLHVPRAIGFMLVGIMIGVGLGVAARSVRRGQNAVLGGAVGGFIGGFMFDYISSWIGAESGFVPRLIALTLTGALIGFAIGLVDDIRRDLWLEIVSGGMAGKQFIVWEERCMIGSDSSCDITLIKDPAIAPQHAVLTRSGAVMRIEVQPGSPMISVDGVSTESAVLSGSSMIQIGGTVLRIGQKSAQLPTFTPA